MRIGANSDDRPTSGEPLLVLGASARAAAQSARRGGFLPLAADLFADGDLAACARVVRISDYPHEFLTAARRFPRCEWIYTGGLENYPKLVDRIARERPLLGNSGEVLRRVRNPRLVRDALIRANLPSSRICDPGETPRDGEWLQKPLRSSAGRGIRHWRAGESPPPAGHYLQAVERGESQSGVFIAAQSEARLLGVTRQLVGEEWLGAPPFAYCGSIGPLALSEHSRHGWQRLGDCLAKEFSLTGIFGIDAIVGEGRIVPVELNPRYTASAELIERSANGSAVAWHCRVCRDGDLKDTAAAGELDAAPTRYFGKAVLYARRNEATSHRVTDWLTHSPSIRWPAFADIPQAEAPIAAGHPLLTLFSEGGSPADAEANLREKARQTYEAVSPGTTPHSAP
jgi:predicted ATP-grasp superfamily ATP-dependent carboligase